MVQVHRLKAVLTLGVVAIAAGGGVAMAAGGGAHARSPTGNLKASKTKFRFNTSHVTVSHGKVTFRMSNPSSFRHGIAVEGHGVDKDGKPVNKGGVSTVTVTLKKGTYEYYCPVDSHKQKGMKGT